MIQKSESVIKRSIYPELRDHLNKKEITLIVGPRQAGKTTLMRVLERECKNSGTQTLFFSLDSTEDARYFASQQSLIGKLKLELGDANSVVFVDEIQRREDAGIFLKGIYDMDLPYKFVISGSGSIELREKVHESLAGRKLMFEVLPLSFLEFFNHSTSYKYEGCLEQYFAVEGGITQRLLEEYLQFGGYPRVVLENTLPGKARIIEEIYRSYIEKDISALLRVEKLDAFRLLVETLASQSGKILTFSELANTLSLSLPTVHNYLWYLEHTFIVERVTPYFTNKRKEITKSPTLYFIDIGMRNFALGRFGAPLIRDDTGFLFQTLIYQLLATKIQHSGARIHFWRTKEKSEVDFVVTRGDLVTPVEVKYSSSGQTVGRSLHAFIKRYSPKRAFIVTPHYRKNIQVGDTSVMYVPFTDLLIPNNEALF